MGELVAPAIEAIGGFLGDAGSAIGGAVGGIGDALSAPFGGAAGGGAAALEGLGGGTAAATLPGSDIASIVGTGEGLFGGATGTAGAELAGGVSAADLASGAAFGTTGLSALGTATDFLTAPAASGFNAAALTPGISGSAADAAAAVPGGGPGLLQATAPPPTPTGVGGTSVFDTGTSGVPGVSSTGAPAATAAPSAVAPPGASAASVAAPSGVSGVPDATAAATGATPAAGTAAPAAQTSSIDQLLNKMSPSNLANSAVSSLTNNPLGVALGAGGLGYSIYEGTQQTANEKALSAAAASSAAQGQTALNAGLPIAQQNAATGNNLVNQGEALQTYLTSGTLPPQYMTQIQEATQAAITNAKSNAAAQGQSTDPTQNTSLATAIEQINNQIPGMITSIANTLFSAGGTDISAGTGATANSASSLLGAGATASGLSGSLYSTLVQNDTTQAANAGKAIATLAAALNGKSSNSIGGVTVSTG